MRRLVDILYDKWADNAVRVVTERSPGVWVQLWGEPLGRDQAAKSKKRRG
jgi:hypothetical protein